jgi:hypothetical protein
MGVRRFGHSTRSETRRWARFVDSLTDDELVQLVRLQRQVDRAVDAFRRGHVERKRAA